MKAIETLRRFARNGVAVEGRGRLVALVAAAVMAAGAALAPGPADAGQIRRDVSPSVAQIESQIARNYGNDERFPDLPGMGILHDASYPKMVARRREGGQHRPPPGDDGSLRNHTGKGVSFDYGAMVKDIQAQVEAEFPGKVHIVDRSRPVEEEAAKVAGIIGTRFGKDDLFRLQGDPHSMPGVGPKATICVVIGPKAELDVRDLTASMVEDLTGSKEPLAFKGDGVVTDAFFHRLMLWHEVGHCLDGGSEARADVFSLLKGMSESKSGHAADFMIALRELMERVSVPMDRHIISPAMRLAVEKYGNPEFWTRPHSLDELGRMADGIKIPVDAHTIFLRNTMALTRMDPMKPAFDFRGTEYLVPVKEGFAVTDFLGWVKSAHAIPEVARIQELVDYLEGDPRTRQAPGPFVENREASIEAVTALAAAGDPTARDIAWAFGAPGPVADAALTGADKLPGHEAIGGRLIAFDREAAKVQFANDSRSFLVRDAHTGKPLLSGDAAHGIMKTFAGLDERHAASAGYAGPAR